VFAVECESTRAFQITSVMCCWYLKSPLLLKVFWYPMTLAVPIFIFLTVSVVVSMSRLSSMVIPRYLTSRTSCMLFTCRETNLCSPVGALFGGTVDFPHCCFVERYYETLVVVYFCDVVLRPLLDYC
jgi:hypothetical protein